MTKTIKNEQEILDDIKNGLTYKKIIEKYKVNSSFITRFKKKHNLLQSQKSENDQSFNKPLKDLKEKLSFSPKGQQKIKNEINKQNKSIMQIKSPFEQQSEQEQSEQEEKSKIVDFGSGGTQFFERAQSSQSEQEQSEQEEKSKIVDFGSGGTQFFERTQSSQSEQEEKSKIVDFGSGGTQFFERTQSSQSEQELSEQEKSEEQKSEKQNESQFVKTIQKPFDSPKQNTSFVNFLKQYDEDKKQLNTKVLMQPGEIVQKQEVVEKANQNNLDAKQQEVVKKQQEVDFSFQEKQKKIQEISKEVQLEGKECYIIQIRKYIQNFKDKEEIQEIIGKNKSQNSKFISQLPLKTEEQLKFIRDTIKFELLLSQLDQKTIPDNIHQFLKLIEQGLLTINIDVCGCADELFQEESFKFYLTMCLCEISYLPSPKQMVFFKFVKSYYYKFMQKKQQKEIQQKLQQPANAQLIQLAKQI